jgi:hypothetical protein
MAFLNMLDKVDDFFYKPMETICNWLQEPLKIFEAKRNMTAEEKKHELERIDREHAAKLESDMKKLDFELEELRKDKVIERNKATLETIKKYKADMAKLSVEIVNTIGNMTLDLRERANNFVQDNVKRYKELQDDAITKADKRLEEIETKYPEGSKSKEIMQDAVAKQMNSIIDRADNFMNTLNDDLKKITSMIDDITLNLDKSVENVLHSNMSNTPVLDGNGNETRRVN